jgi:hypothetical protein
MNEHSNTVQNCSNLNHEAKHDVSLCRLGLLLCCRVASTRSLSGTPRMVVGCARTLSRCVFFSHSNRTHAQVKTQSIVPWADALNTGSDDQINTICATSQQSDYFECHTSKAVCRAFSPAVAHQSCLPGGCHDGAPQLAVPCDRTV